MRYFTTNFTRFIRLDGIDIFEFDFNVEFGSFPPEFSSKANLELFADNLGCIASYPITYGLADCMKMMILYSLFYINPHLKMVDISPKKMLRCIIDDISDEKLNEYASSSNNENTYKFNTLDPLEVTPLLFEAFKELGKIPKEEREKTIAILKENLNDLR